MAAVCSKELAVAINVKNLYLGIRRGRQEQMICGRNESKSVNRLCAMFPSMYELPTCRSVPLPNVC